MKRVFTICVPDGCYLKVANIVALVEKDDHSNNGITIFTADSIGDEEQEWLFATNGKAKQVSSENPNKWIPVSERLPEDAQNVLVTRACRRNRRFVETGEIISGTWISPNDEYRIEVDSYTVIAWMPLPEPYKAESEEQE